MYLDEVLRLCLQYRSVLCDSSEAVNGEYLAFVRFVLSKEVYASAGVSGTRIGRVLDGEGQGLVAAVEERGDSTQRFVESCGVRDTVVGGVDAEDGRREGRCAAERVGDSTSDGNAECGGSADADGKCSDGVCRDQRSDSSREGLVFGRWAASNRRKKEKRKANKRNNLIPEWRRSARPVGFCETVLTQSSCPSYGQAVSDAEREAKESLAKRRAAENALQEKLAKMKLADLEDEQKCQEYAQLKRQRVIQWTNEATAKSQQSLEKCKSIDPGSSSSQFEIRKTVKELEDLKLQHAHLIKVFHDAVPDAAKIIAMTKLPGTESMERYQLEGEFIGGWGDDHSISS